ncbi:MAG: SGNH/GDSL hydrolase family protein [Sediminibacterium sp.]
MHTSKFSNLFYLLLLMCLVWSCQTVLTTTSSKQFNKIEGESFVLAANNPANFLYTSIVKGSVTVRSTYLPTDSGSIIYTEGTDYTIDYKKGTLARTAGSRIPDYAKHPLFEKTDFNQNNFPNYSNNPFFVWVDYASKKSDILNDDKTSTVYLSKFKTKLERGEKVSIVSYGNSITAGIDLSNINNRLQNRWARYLQTQYPNAAIELQDASLPGYTTLEAIAYWEAYIGKKNPDLVILGWGMNEANVGGMSPSEYQNNLVKLVQMTRAQKNAEVIIYSCFRPNENWHYASHSMNLYTEAAKKAAEMTNCAYVNVYDIFEKVFARKDQPSLLSNNINHPNSFGHWLYFQAFKNLKF